MVSLAWPVLGVHGVVHQRHWMGEKVLRHALALHASQLVSSPAAQSCPGEGWSSQRPEPTSGAVLALSPVLSVTIGHDLWN